MCVHSSFRDVWVTKRDGAVLCTNGGTHVHGGTTRLHRVHNEYRSQIARTRNILKFYARNMTNSTETEKWCGVRS